MLIQFYPIVFEGFGDLTEEEDAQAYLREVALSGGSNSLSGPNTGYRFVHLGIIRTKKHQKKTGLA